MTMLLMPSSFALGLGLEPGERLAPNVSNPVAQLSEPFQEDTS